MNLCRTIRRRQAAYTMVELMGAVLISVVLVVAMYQIFARVQSVFTTGHSRTKLLEEGRAVMDLIVRDLGRMAPAGMWEPNFIAKQYQTTRIETLGYPDNWETLRADQQNTWLTTTEPFVSSRVSFLGHDDQWQKMAYRLESRGQPGKANDVIGALWRYESKPIPKRDIIRLGSSNRDGEYQKLSDNVVHFRMRAVSPHDPGRALWVNPEFRFHTLPLYVEVEIGLIEEKLKKEILNDGDVERWAVELENILSGNPSVGRGRQMDENGDGKISHKEFLGPKHLFDQFDTNKDKFLSISRAVYAMRHARVMKLLNDNLGRILMLRQLVPIRRQADISPTLFVKKTPKEFKANGFSVTGGVTGAGFPAGGNKPARHIFIIDKSASMAQEQRFESAKSAMIETMKKLERLNPSADFYVFFFSTDLEGMPSGPATPNNPPPDIARKLVPATSGMVEFYTKWVNNQSYDESSAKKRAVATRNYEEKKEAYERAFRLRPELWSIGWGVYEENARLKWIDARNELAKFSNPEQALVAAFQMNPDTIWLLTGGQIQDFIVPGIANLNAARATPVRVNTIGLGRSKDISGRDLSQIAVDNEGVYTFVSTDPEDEE